MKVVNGMRFAAVVAATLQASAVLAEDYPTKPVTVINGAAVGGGVDTYARVLASVGADLLGGQPMVVVNKPGAGHTIALKTLKEATPDGYTLGVVSAGSGVLAAKLRNIGWKLSEEFDIVAQYGVFNAGLFVRKDSLYESAADVIEAVRANPGTLRYGHSGRGTSVHIAMASWLEANDLEMQDIPFQGGAKSRAAVIAGDVDFVSTGVQQLAGFEDKLRVLALFTDERDQIMSDIPTMKELGIPNIPVYSPVMVFAPKGTPKDVLQKLEDAVKGATENKAFLKLAKGAGLNVTYRDGAEARSLIQGFEENWTPIVEQVR